MLRILNSMVLTFHIFATQTPKGIMGLAPQNHFFFVQCTSKIILKTFSFDMKKMDRNRNTKPKK